jgi:hypothetical protein
MTLIRIGRRPSAAMGIDRMCEEIDRAAKERNELVHALWVRGQHGSPLIQRVMARGILQHEKKGKHAKSIEGVAALIAARSHALQEFLEQKGIVSFD